MTERIVSQNRARRWNGPDVLRMGRGATALLKCRPEEVQEELWQVFLLDMPPLSIYKLSLLMERRHRDYRETDFTMRDLLLREYGQEALEFVLRFAGIEASEGVTTLATSKT